MKQLLLLVMILTFSNSNSQESWLRIYQSGSWQIKSFYKIHTPTGNNSIYVQHNSNDTLVDSQNGALKKYSPYNNSWNIAANGFLNTGCGTCIDPPYMWTQCMPLPFFMISSHDQSTILKFRVTNCAQCPDANTYVTRTNGNDWESFYNIFGCGGSLIFPNGGDIDPINEAVWYYGYSNGYTSYHSSIFKSTNSGVNWFLTATIPGLRVVASGFPWTNNQGGLIKVNPFNTNYILTSHRDYMMLSTDAGLSFNALPVPPLKELAFDYTNDIIFGVTQNTIYSSPDNGLNWISSEIPFSLNTIEVSPDNSNIIYAGSTAGLYRSSNGGQSWYLYNNTFSPSKNVIGISKDPISADTVIVSTEDAVYKVFRDQLTGVTQSNTIIPSSFKLSQNYPNPFNPKTIINYELPEHSGNNSFYNVRLTVYNILGTEVATLVNKKQSAGSYYAEFDAAVLASGNYFYKIVVNSEENSFFEVKKMTLLK